MAYTALQNQEFDTEIKRMNDDLPRLRNMARMIGTYSDALKKAGFAAAAVLVVNQAGGSRVFIIRIYFQNMGKFFRTWYLLTRLRAKGIKGTADAPSIEQIVEGKLWMEKSRFLKDINTRLFFMIPRSARSQKKRIGKDDQLIEACCADTPPKAIESTAQALGVDSDLDVPPRTPFIRVTGHGGEFTDLFNFIFVEIAGKYSIVWGIMIGVVGYIWAPHILPFIYFAGCKITTFNLFCS